MLKKSTFIIVVSMLISYGTATAGHAQTPLKIAYPTFPPFFWSTEKGEMKGFFYEIIMEAVVKRMALPDLNARMISFSPLVNLASSNVSSSLTLMAIIPF